MPSTRPQTNIRLEDSVRDKAKQLGEAWGGLTLSSLVRLLIVQAHRTEFGSQDAPEKKSKKSKKKG